MLVFAMKLYLVSPSWDVKGRMQWKVARALVKAHLKQKNREKEAALDREREARERAKWIANIMQMAKEKQEKKRQRASDGGRLN